MIWLALLYNFISSHVIILPDAFSVSQNTGKGATQRPKCSVCEAVRAYHGTQSYLAPPLWFDMFVYLYKAAAGCCRRRRLIPFQTNLRGDISILVECSTHD